MKIAILGTRGIPANYGGFETFTENLSVRLAERGHEVTVYGRSGYIKTEEKYFKGVRLRLFPTIISKYIDTPLNSMLTTAHVLFQSYDVLLYCNAANAIYTFLPRVFGKKVALNVDGNLKTLVQAGENGFLVEKTNPNEFAQSILTITNDSHLKKRFGQQSRMIIEENHRLTDSADAYNRIIKELVPGL